LPRIRLLLPLLCIKTASEEGLLFRVMAYEIFFHLSAYYTELLPYFVPLSQTVRVDLVKVYGKKCV